MGSSSRRTQGSPTGSDLGAQHDPAKPVGDPEPPVMWPGAGSGFEADPFSPAGSLQREAMFLQGASADGARTGRAVLWVVLGVIAVATFSFGVTYLLHHH